MANGGRKLTIIAGVYTLIQGLLWSVLSILCVAIYGCIIYNPLIPLGENTVNVYTLLYASYFNGSSCHDGPQFNGLDGPAPSSLRTYYWMLGYAIISAVWIPVSVLLIVSGVSKVKGVCGSYFYFPWILVSLIIAIMDIVAIVIYCIDITETMSTDEYATFIGGHGTWEEMTGVGSSGQDPAAPAVVMILFFSRFVIFWFLNVSFIVHCIKESNQIRQFELQGSIASDIYTSDEKFRTWNRPNMNQHGFNFDEKRRTQFVTPPVNRSNRQRKNGASEVNINEDKNIIHESEPHNNGRFDPHPHRFNSEAQNNHQRFQRNPKQIEESRTNPKVMYEVDEFGIPIDEIKLPRANNSSYTDSTGSDTPISSPVFDYLGRPARPPPFRNGTEQLIGTESTVKPWNPSSQELRNQAPWSYLHPPPVSQPPQPMIPAPDYTHPRHQRSPYAPSRPTIIKQKQNQRRVHGLQ